MSRERRIGGLGAALGLAAAAALAADVAACSRDHGILAGTGAASTTAAASGAGGAPTGGGPPVSVSSSGGGGAATVGTGAGAGPAGPARLTLLDAIADSDAIRVCFLPWPDGDDTAMPWPAAGLAFGAATVVDLDGSVVPASTDVQLVVIGGDLSLSAG
ncbi:MAG TPA: hypothetical protein VGM56_29700, partial [Byssovorax sp.]